MTYQSEAYSWDRPSGFCRLPNGDWDYPDPPPLAITPAGGTRKIWVDGVLVASDTSVGSASLGSPLGSRVQKLDDVRGWWTKFSCGIAGPRLFGLIAHDTLNRDLGGADSPLAYFDHLTSTHGTSANFTAPVPVGGTIAALCATLDPRSGSIQIDSTSSSPKFPAPDRRAAFV